MLEMVSWMLRIRGTFRCSTCSGDHVCLISASIVSIYGVIYSTVKGAWRLRKSTLLPNPDVRHRMTIRSMDFPEDRIMFSSVLRIPTETLEVSVGEVLSKRDTLSRNCSNSMLERDMIQHSPSEALSKAHYTVPPHCQTHPHHHRVQSQHKCIDSEC